MLDIGSCNYVSEIQPLALTAALTADGMTPSDALVEKREQKAMLDEFVRDAPPVSLAWADSDEE